MQSFKALRIHEIDRKVVARFDTISLEELSAGDTVAVSYTHLTLPTILRV